jgi:hypothetical protein
MRFDEKYFLLLWENAVAYYTAGVVVKSEVEGLAPVLDLNEKWNARVFIFYFLKSMPVK